MIYVHNIYIYVYTIIYTYGMYIYMLKARVAAKTLAALLLDNSAPCEWVSRGHRI